jgi:hypothetical protein
MINVANAAGSTPGLIPLLFFPALMIETRCARHTPRGFESAFTKNGVAVVGIDCELPARQLQTPACWQYFERD